jgi:hypothetical protein
MSGSSKWSLPLSFPHQNPVCIFPHPHTCYMPYKTTGKIIVLYILIFTFLGSKFGRQKILYWMIANIPRLLSAFMT